jgi:hypothetical protein
VVENALATADTARIEAQDREAALREHVKQVVDDLVVHRSPEFGVRMEHQRDRRIGLLARLITAFEPAFRAVEDDFGHGALFLGCRSALGQLDERDAAT